MSRSTRNLKAINREAFKEEMERVVSQSPALTQLTVSNVSVRQVCPSNTKESASTLILPLVASVSEQLLDLKRQRRRAERRWLKSGLKVDS